MAEEYLVVKDLHKSFNDHLAVDGVSFSIEKGEIFGLLGPNGAGKTTTIRMLSTVLEADSGEITIGGHSVHREAEAVRSLIGVCPQEIALYEDLSALENMVFFGRMAGLGSREAREQAMANLKLMGLVERARGKVAKFSGGMKRRINLAIALMGSPHLLFLDEPTVGIDPQSRNHILESVRTLRDGGTTILYTSHYMEEVQAIASRVLIMDLGRIIAGGSVEELVERIQYEERVSLEMREPTPALMEELGRIAGVKQVTRQGTGLSIVSQAGVQNLDRIISCAQAAGGVRSIRTEKPTLEDVFLTLTGKKLRDGEANGGGR
jgi:ABC-2 type transport system ATP-binding protein